MYISKQLVGILFDSTQPWNQDYLSKAAYWTKLEQMLKQVIGMPIRIFSLGTRTAKSAVMLQEAVQRDSESITYTSWTKYESHIMNPIQICGWGRTGMESRYWLMGYTASCNLPLSRSTTTVSPHVAWQVLVNEARSSQVTNYRAGQWILYRHTWLYRYRLMKLNLHRQLTI